MGPLTALNCLIVEDEAVIAMLVEDVLADLGCTEARIAATVQAALAAIDARKPDIAVLDVNLSDAAGYPVAEKLKAMGVRFLFTTGFGAGGLPPEWANWTVVQKPFSPEALSEALINLAKG